MIDMKLYGAKVTQQYLQLPRGRRKMLYPNSNEYPASAKYYYVPIDYSWRYKNEYNRRTEGEHSSIY